MKRMMGGAAILAAAMMVAPIQSHAQQGPGRAQGQRVAAPRPGIEMILRQREQLELTQSQISQLDKLRAEAVQRRSAHQAQMAELRSKVLAGEMTREELQKAVQAQREGATDIQKQQQEKVLGILTDAQKEKVKQWQAQARGFRQGRAAAMRGGRMGQGMMGGRGGMMGRRGGMMGGRGGMMGAAQGMGGQMRAFMRGGFGGRGLMRPARPDTSVAPGRGGSGS
jgi:hypothetical protein